MPEIVSHMNFFKRYLFKKALLEDKLADEKRKKKEFVIEKQPATVSVEEDRTETEETKTALKADVESEYKILGSIDNFVIIFFILRY